MKNFTQWLQENGIDLSERGARTALSPNYPPAYHSKRLNPVNDWMPTSAGTFIALKNGLADEKSDELSNDAKKTLGVSSGSEKKSSNPWAKGFNKTKP